MPLHSLPTSPEALAVSPGIALGVGAALLIAGRKLFWLFVGAIGFFAFARVATEFLGEQHQDWVLIGSAIAGVVGAIFAIFVQKFAVGLSGAVMGVYMLDQFFRHALGSYPTVGLLFLAIAAVVGAVVTIIVFDWALVFLTSLLGAHLIAQLVNVPTGWMMLLYVCLIALGVGIQSGRRKSNS